PTRMWELLAGCMLANIHPQPIKKYNSLVSIIGAILFCIGLFVINESSVFPGLITLLPIGGVVLMIMAGKNGVGYLISNKPFLFLGAISYSLYMWHWPLIIYIKVFYPNYEFSILSSLLFIAVL